MLSIWLQCCITAGNVNSFGRIFSWRNSSNLFIPHEIGIFHLVKFLLSIKFWTNFARWNFSSQLVLMKLTQGTNPIKLFTAVMYVTTVKSLIGLAPGHNVIKLFWSVIKERL
jgi:hypothetical protein